MSPTEATTPARESARRRHYWIACDGLAWERRAGIDASRWNGAALRRHREAAGWTRCELAAALGFVECERTIARWESGQSVPGGPAVAILAATFGLSVTAFYAPPSADVTRHA